MLKHFLRSQKGAAITEYQVAAIVGLVAIIAASFVGPIVERMYTRSNIVIKTGEGLESRLVMEDVEVIEELEELPPPVTISMRYACFNEGMVAAGETAINSRNHFGPGFCLHGNEGVWLRNNNYFAYGSVVSTSDADNFDIVNFESNEGLEEALQIAQLDIRVDETLVDAFAHLIDPARNGRPSYLDPDAPVVQLRNRKIKSRDLQSGRVHSLSCRGNQSMNLSAISTLKNVALITNCRVRINSNMLITNAVLGTTSTANNAVQVASNLQIGANDNCTDGGGGQILSIGDVKVAAQTGMYGGHIVSAGDISVTSQVDGQGALLLAGGDLSGTSNISMLSCDGIGQEDNVVMTWWELVLSYFSS